MHKAIRTLTVFLIGLMSAGLVANAAEFETEHKLVMHVNSNDPVTQRIAINNANNLLKVYGPENITIEIVAHGPGLSILAPSGTQAARIPALAKSGVTFSACAVTMNKIKHRTGKTAKLIKGVSIVPAGVARIIELQEKGYSYVKP